MTDTFNTARRNAAKKVAAARRRVEATAEEARDRAVDAAGAGRAWAADSNDALRHLMRDRPIASAGVSAATAFIAGLVVGVLLERAVEATEERQWQKRLRAAKSHLPNWRDY